MKAPTRFAELRRARGLTQQQVADAVGVSTVTVYRWERSELKPKAYILPTLASLFGTTVDYLLGETDDPAPAGRATSGITQSVTGIGNISNNMIASTMTAPTEFPEAISPEPKPQTPWWIDAVTKAYEMERTQDVRAMEAARALQLALDVLERTASQVTTA